MEAVNGGRNKLTAQCPSLRPFIPFNDERMDEAELLGDPVYLYIYIYIFFFISDGGSERTVGFFMLVFIGLAMNGKFVARLLTRKHIKKYIYMFIYMFMHWTILRVSVFI